MNEWGESKQVFSTLSINEKFFDSVCVLCSQIYWGFCSTIGKGRESLNVHFAAYFIQSVYWDAVRFFFIRHLMERLMIWLCQDIECICICSFQFANIIMTPAQRCIDRKSVDHLDRHKIWRINFADFLAKLLKMTKHFSEIRAVK